jgi:hypothetical protein
LKVGQDPKFLAKDTSGNDFDIKNLWKETDSDLFLSKGQYARMHGASL